MKHLLAFSIIYCFLQFNPDPVNYLRGIDLIEFQHVFKGRALLSWVSCLCVMIYCAFIILSKFLLLVTFTFNVRSFPGM